MNSRFPARLVLLAAAVSTACSSTTVLAAGSRRPNILLIVADDLGYGDLGCYGRKDVRTPNLDRLAAEGVRFTQCYANGPECTPTRTAFLTGRYQQRVGGLECAIGTGNVGRYDDAIRLRATDQLGLPVEETSLARMLKDGGYATMMAGKWHLGYPFAFSPSRHGFDFAFYLLGGGADYFHHTETNGDRVLYRDEQPVKQEGYFTDLVTEEAASLILRNHWRPFFLYVAYTAPHAPYQGPGDRTPKPLPADSPLQDQAKAPPAVYRAMIERMDEGVGRILGALEKHKIDQKTLVIFASDNGATRSGRNAPFSGYKGTTFEGGIRVPAIARWPGVLPRGTVSRQVAITMDFTRSILAAAGVEPQRKPDGIDVLRQVASGKPPQERTLFWRARRGDRTWWAVRDGSLKYIREAQGAKSTEYLFDLTSDPAESKNLLRPRSADAQRLKALLVAWEKEVRPTR